MPITTIEFTPKEISDFRLFLEHKNISLDDKNKIEKFLKRGYFDKEEDKKINTVQDFLDWLDKNASTHSLGKQAYDLLVTYLHESI